MVLHMVWLLYPFFDIVEKRAKLRNSCSAECTVQYGRERERERVETNGTTSFGLFGYLQIDKATCYKHCPSSPLALLEDEASNT